MQREAGILSSQRHVKTEVMRNESTLLSQRSKSSIAKPIRYSMSKCVGCGTVMATAPSRKALVCQACTVPPKRRARRDRLANKAELESRRDVLDAMSQMVDHEDGQGQERLRHLHELWVEGAPALWAQDQPPPPMKDAKEQAPPADDENAPPMPPPSPSLYATTAGSKAAHRRVRRRQHEFEKAAERATAGLQPTPLVTGDEASAGSTAGHEQQRDGAEGMAHAHCMSEGGDGTARAHGPTHVPAALLAQEIEKLKRPQRETFSRAGRGWSQKEEFKTARINAIAAKKAGDAAGRLMWTRLVMETSPDALVVKMAREHDALDAVATKDVRSRAAALREAHDRKVASKVAKAAYGKGAQRAHGDMVGEEPDPVYSKLYQDAKRRQTSGPMLALNRLGEGGFDDEGERMDDAPPAYSSPTRNGASTVDETPGGTSNRSETIAVDGRKVGQRLYSDALNRRRRIRHRTEEPDSTLGSGDAVVADDKSAKRAQWGEVPDSGSKFGTFGRASRAPPKGLGYVHAEGDLGIGGRESGVGNGEGRLAGAGHVHLLDEVSWLANERTNHAHATTSKENRARKLATEKREAREAGAEEGLPGTAAEIAKHSANGRTLQRATARASYQSGGEAEVEGEAGGGIDAVAKAELRKKRRRLKRGRTFLPSQSRVGDGRRYDWWSMEGGTMDVTLAEPSSGGGSASVTTAAFWAATLRSTRAAFAYGWEHESRLLPTDRSVEWEERRARHAKGTASAMAVWRAQQKLHTLAWCVLRCCGNLEHGTQLALTLMRPAEAPKPVLGRSGSPGLMVRLSADALRRSSDMNARSNAQLASDSLAKSVHQQVTVRLTALPPKVITVSLFPTQRPPPHHRGHPPTPTTQHLTIQLRADEGSLFDLLQALTDDTVLGGRHYFIRRPSKDSTNVSVTVSGMAAAKRLLSMSVDEEGLTWQALLDRYKIRPKRAGGVGAENVGAKWGRMEKNGEEKEGGVEDGVLAGEGKEGGVEDDEYEYNDDFEGDGVQEVKCETKHEEAVAVEEEIEDRWDEEGEESRVRVVLTRNTLSAGCRVRVSLPDPPAPHPPRPMVTGTIAEVNYTDEIAADPDSAIGLPMAVGHNSFRKEVSFPTTGACLGGDGKAAAPFTYGSHGRICPYYHGPITMGWRGKDRAGSIGEPDFRVNLRKRRVSYAVLLDDGRRLGDVNPKAIVQASLPAGYQTTPALKASSGRSPGSISSGIDTALGSTTATNATGSTAAADGSIGTSNESGRMLVSKGTSLAAQRTASGLKVRQRIRITGYPFGERGFDEAALQRLVEDSFCEGFGQPGHSVRESTRAQGEVIGLKYVKSSKEALVDIVGRHAAAAALANLNGFNIDSGETVTDQDGSGNAGRYGDDRRLLRVRAVERKATAAGGVLAEIRLEGLANGCTDEQVWWFLTVRWGVKGVVDVCVDRPKHGGADTSMVVGAVVEVAGVQQAQLLVRSLDRRPLPPDSGLAPIAPFTSSTAREDSGSGSSRGRSSRSSVVVHKEHRDKDVYRHQLRVRINTPGDWDADFPGGKISRSERPISERTVAEQATTKPGPIASKSTTRRAKTKQSETDAEDGGSAYKTSMTENGGNLTMQSFGRNVTITVPRKHTGGKYKSYLTVDNSREERERTKDFRAAAKARDEERAAADAAGEACAALHERQKQVTMPKPTDGMYVVPPDALRAGGALPPKNRAIPNNPVDLPTATGLVFWAPEPPSGRFGVNTAKRANERREQEKAMVLEGLAAAWESGPQPPSEEYDDDLIPPPAYEPYDGPDPAEPLHQPAPSKPTPALAVGSDLRVGLATGYTREKVDFGWDRTNAKGDGGDDGYGRKAALALFLTKIDPHHGKRDLAATNDRLVMDDAGQLVELKLSKTDLRGEANHLALACSPSLQKMDASFNGLECEEFQSILTPSLTASLSSLRVVNLAGNYLRGALPKEWGALASGLQELYLGDNQLGGSLEGLASLANLKVLSLSGNLLHGSLAPLATLRKLGRLLVARNGIQEGTAELGSLSGLQLIDVRDNPLCFGAEPGVSLRRTLMANHPRALIYC